jgi:microcystin-dependent protein
MSQPYLGEIRIFGGNFAPRGNAMCNGQLLAISQNTALFSILGTTYGGNGTTNFALPDLRGRVPIHMGQGPGLSNYVLGQQDGSEAVTLNTTQIPSHTHTATAHCHSEAGNSKDPTSNVWSKDAGVSSAVFSTSSPDGTMNSAAVTVDNSGGGNQPHPNIQPYLTVNFIIALEGIFPSRN